jgi:hypothetical protein
MFKAFPQGMLATSHAADMLQEPSGNVYFSLTPRGESYKNLEHTIELLKEVVELCKILVQADASPNSDHVFTMDTTDMSPYQKLIARIALEEGMIVAICPYTADRATIVNEITGNGGGLNFVITPDED